MRDATLVIRDCPDGSIEMYPLYGPDGEYDHTSNAHRTMILIRKVLDRLLGSPVLAERADLSPALARVAEDVRNDPSVIAEMDTADGWPQPVKKVE